MGVLPVNREVHEAATFHRRGGQVLRDAPRVCPPPMRTKEQKRTKRSQDKLRSSRLATLTRPTVSSRAKERSKTPSPSTGKTPLKGEKAKSATKTKKTCNSKKSLKPHVESVTPVFYDVESIMESDAKSSEEESLYADALAECDSDVYFFDKRDLNPLLYDVGDFVFDSFSEDSFSSVSCSSSLSSCMDFEECQRREKWNRFFSLTHSVACAVSFAAGLTLGMAIGACSLVQSPQSS